MKYIKKFESDYFTYYTIDNIKKYIVWEFPTNLIVLEVTKVSSTDITCLRLYVMSIGSLHTVKSDKSEFILPIVTAKKKIIYQSDNLQEVLDILPELPEINNNINKFNI